MAEQRGASAIRAVIRQTLAQRRIPPHVVEYARQHLLQAWRFARRRLVDLTREPQRIAARRAVAGAARDGVTVVRVDGAWQAAVPFRGTAVREVAIENLTAVAGLLEAASVPFFVRDAASRGPATVGVDAAHRQRVWEALTSVAPHEHRYVCAPGAGPPIALHRAPRVIAGMYGADRALVYRNHRISDDYVVGAAQGCMIEFWERAGANLRAPAGARPGRLVPEAVDAAEIVVAGRRLPTVSAFADHRALSAAGQFPVDVVYTWVDDDDPEWRERLARHRRAWDGGPLHPQAANPSRYRNRDELRYSLRSLALYADFVRRVFVVTDGQVPPWLDVDHPAITVVDHGEILEPTDLPTFNSHAIEARLHHIDGLAEHYLYLNDDFFLGRQVTAATFFTPNGLPKVFADETAPIPAGPPSPRDRPVDSASKNVRDLMRTHLGVRVGRKLLHVPYPQRRSVLAEMEKRFPDEFARTAASRFRQPADLNVASCFSHYYAFATGRAVVGDIAGEYINIGFRWAPLQMRRLLEQRDRDAFCLNETDIDPGREPGVDDAVARFLRAYLPVPSPYERPGRDSPCGAEERRHVGEPVDRR